MNSFKIVFIIFIITVMLAVLSCSTRTTTQGETDPAFQLNLEAPIDKWDEAIPLGNGLTGGLLWGGENIINVSLDRGDLWDIRPHPGYTIPGFTYETVKRMALAGQTDSLNKQYARISDYPTKLPGCRLVLTLPESMKAESFHLDMKRGLGSIDLGDGRIECFFSAVKSVALIKIPGSFKDYQLVSNPAVRKLGNEPARIEKDDDGICLIQDAALGFRYVFCVRSKRFRNYTLLAISSSTTGDTDDPLKLARSMAQQALSTSYVRLLRENEAWWTGFWSKSSVTVPDPVIQQHYNLVQYFYGAASSKGAPPMPLQGVWTADAGSLPPWHGDYHHDLNTQLTYWAYLTSNRFDQGLSFLNFMWSLKPVHENFAHNFFGTEGIVVPGVMSFDGKPMGAWYPYSLSPTMGAWIAQSFYWHWRYTMDQRFLKERAYPYCAGIAEGLAGLMKPDENGRLKLSLSSSPEIHNNTQQAWLTPDSNFDLALIRWIFGVNAEMAEALGMDQMAIRWRDLLAKMDDLAVEGVDGTLLVSPGEALKESHRHFSHLMAIHPLGILNIEGTDRDRKIINASLEQIDTFGSKLWCGYSFSWMACMRARVGQADRALESLKDYMDCTLRNGFHVNGPQTRKELSDYNTMRAFTLEGNFAASQAVHEMLLQSWGNLVRIFPATPAGWTDVSFSQLRAEGGFMVSAERKDGKTVRVTITATVDQTLRLRNPFDQQEYESNIAMERKGNNELQFQMKKGQILKLNMKGKV
jgi:alpha-L-fucosidase 2